MADNHTDDKDLLDEILTMDGLHDIDNEPDSKRGGDEPSSASTEKMDESLFEQLLWQPTEEIDEEIPEVAAEPTVKEEVDESKDEVQSSPTRKPEERFSPVVTCIKSEFPADASGIEVTGAADDSTAEAGTIAVVTSATLEKDKTSTAEELSADEGSRKRKQISPIMWSKIKEEEAAEESEKKKPKTEETAMSVEAERNSRLKYLFRSARFFIIKSNNYENVALAKARGIWSTPPQNEARLNQAFRQCANVILVFSIQESGKFQGYARLASESDKSHPPVRWVLPPGLEAKVFSSVFKLDWINRRDLPFTETMHLKNPWNMHKPVKVGRDGQEVEPTIGEALCRLFPADDNIDVNHIVHLAKQTLRKLERGTSATGTSGGGTGASASAQTRAATSKSPTSSSSSREKRSKEREDSSKPHHSKDRRDGHRDRECGEGIPVRYGVRTETLLNGTYSDYVREFNKIPTVTHQMPSYAPAVAPAYSYVHPHYLYDQQMQQSYGMPAMTAAGYMPNYAERPVADHHHHYNYNQYGSEYSRNESSRDYYREHDYRRDHYADHR
jgi:hypothetical protein